MVGLAIAAPLLYAGATKLLDPARFSEAVPRLGFAFLSEIRGAAPVIGAMELLIGAAMVVAPVPATALVAGLLYLFFAAALLRARLRGSNGDCGCFGALGGTIAVASVARNGAFVVAAVGLAYLRDQGRLTMYEPAAASALVVIFTLAAAAADTVMATRARP